MEHTCLYRSGEAEEGATTDTEAGCTGFEEEQIKTSYTDGNQS
jgi:hypothetical protein